MKRIFTIMIVMLTLLLMMSSLAFGVDVLRIKTGVNYVNPELVQPGYTLFTTTWNGGSTMAMIDNYGNLVHYWIPKGTTASIGGITWAQSWPDGNIVTSAFDTVYASNAVADPLAKGVGGDYDTLIEMDWDSNVVWYGKDYFYGPDHAAHHDFKKMWNNKLQAYTYLTLTTNAFSREDAIAQGADAIYDVAQGGYANGWSPDGMQEVNEAGEVVWSWCYADHFVQNYDATKTADFTSFLGRPTRGATFGEPADYPGKFNINHNTDNLTGPTKDWSHCNSLDYRKDLDQCVLNAKNLSEIMVIDHDATFVSTTDWQANIDAAKTDAGDFIYRFGNPANYDMGVDRGYRNEGNHQMWGAHNIQWIGVGGNYEGFEVFGDLPGQGDMFIFDNNCWSPDGTASVALEWNPFLDGDGVDTGDYVDPPSVGYTGLFSKQVTWQYQAGTGFYSFYISSVQRMPNGNSIIDSGAQSHFFEVTADKTLAWEYFKPDISVGFGGATTGDVTISTAGGGFGAPSTFRNTKLPVGHPALEGRDLTPMGNFRQMVIDEKNVGSAGNELKKFLGTF